MVKISADLATENAELGCMDRRDLGTSGYPHLSLLAVVRKGHRIKIHASLGCWMFKQRQDGLHDGMTRWWFQIFFIFTPNLGEMIHFDEHIFQTGWFNHQPA